MLGRWIEHFKAKPWFPVKAASLERAQTWYSRYGKWSLLLSWAPVIGDPLTVVAGVTLAKVGRYLILAAITLGLD